MRLSRKAMKSSVVTVVALAIPLLTSTAIASAATAPPTATTGAVSSVTPASAVVTGFVNPNGSATTWYFEYGATASNTYGSKTAVSNVGSGSADLTVSTSLTGLKPATTYNYRIVASSSGGTTRGGNGIFNTSAAPVVVTGAASSLTATSATLNGIVNPEGLPTSWYFEYGTSTSYGSKTPARPVAVGPNDVKVSAAVSLLLPRTTYHFRLVATSSAGSGYGVDHTLITGLFVTINASTSAVVFGGSVGLSGTVTGGLSGVQVTILSEQFDQAAFQSIATVMTSSGGAWSFAAQPSVRTTFEASTTGGTSSGVVVNVRPAVYLKEVTGGRLVTRVVGGMSFAAHVLQLQRLSQGLWVTWKHVRLNGQSRAMFVTSLPKSHTAIRMAIGPFVSGVDQAAPGFLAGYSRPIGYVGR